MCVCIGCGKSRTVMTCRPARVQPCINDQLCSHFPFVRRVQLYAMLLDPVQSATKPYSEFLEQSITKYEEAKRLFPW